MNTFIVFLTKGRKVLRTKSLKKNLKWQIYVNVTGVKNMAKKTLIILFLSFLLFFGQTGRANALSAGCDASPASLLQVLTSSLTTLYNIFPIQLAGQNLMPFGGPTPNESDSQSQACGKDPVCVCMTPVPRVGLTVAFWEPVLDIETVKSPMCFPALGVSLGSIGGVFNPGRNASQGNGREGVAANIHII
ncbi:MAG: TraU family protein [bacterium]